MLLNNPVRINVSDFDPENQQDIAKLAEILNPFMQEVYDLTSGQIDFVNRVENIKTFDIIVDNSGNSNQIQVINIEKNNIRGLDVIDAKNKTISTGYPTSKPFISYTKQSGTNIKIDNVTGLRPNETYQITVLIY